MLTPAYCTLPEPRGGVLVGPELEVVEESGLDELDELELLVPTGAELELETLVAEVAGGCVGLLEALVVDDELVLELAAGGVPGIHCE
jgi:hypothetical protein